VAAATARPTHLTLSAATLQHAMRVAVTVSAAYPTALILTWLKEPIVADTREHSRNPAASTGKAPLVERTLSGGRAAVGAQLLMVSITVASCSSVGPGPLGLDSSCSITFVFVGGGANSCGGPPFHIMASYRTTPSTSRARVDFNV
jgi:hypothetical protein